MAGPYRQSSSVGLKGRDIPGGSRESIPVIPPPAETGGNCGSWIDGNNFITRFSLYLLLSEIDKTPTFSNTVRRQSLLERADLFNFPQRLAKVASTMTWHKNHDSGTRLSLKMLSISSYVYSDLNVSRKLITRKKACWRREGKAKILAREGRCAIVPHQEILVREASTTWTDRETEEETCRGMKKERENDVKRKERKRHDTQHLRRFFPPIDFTFYVVSRGPISAKLSITSTVRQFLYDTRVKKIKGKFPRTLLIIASRKETGCVFAYAQSPIKVSRLLRSYE